MGYRFGLFELDPETRELKRDGADVHIEPQVFDLVEFLITNRSRLVTKQEIFDHVWSGRFVSDSALSSRIKTARKLLDDDGRKQAVIKTVHGSGFRFVAEAEEVQKISTKVSIISTALDEPAPTGVLDGAKDIQQPEPIVIANEKKSRFAQSARRLVTVLHAAIKLREDVSESIDPEDWKSIVTAFHRQCEKIMSGYSASVSTQPTGSLVAIFGEVRSSEEDAINAVKCALEIAAFQSKGLDDAQIQVNVGVDTGTIISEGGEVSAVGPVISKAERLQLLSPPNSVILGNASEAVAGAYFELEDIPGIGYRVLGSSRSQTRFDVSRARGLSGFVGREHDLAFLEDALSQSERGDSPVIGVVAEAGTGKSRLCFEFLKDCREKGIPVFEGRAVVHGQNVPLLTVLDVFRSFYGIEQDDEEVAARTKIEDKLLSLDADFSDVLPLIFDFLSVADPERPAPRLDPNIRQRRVVQAMRHAFGLASAQQTSVTLIEDLHWMDPASEQILQMMVEPGPGSRNLLILNYRPQYHANWMNRPWFKQLSLSPLNDEGVMDLLRDNLGESETVASLAEPIVAWTGGNPFYAEEVVFHLAETGALEGQRGNYKLVSPVSEIHAPPTVQAVIAARIDRLSETERRVLQLAATIGKDFDQPLLEASSELPAHDIDASLDGLRRTGFILEKAFFPHPIFTFRHALTQEVAHDSLLKSDRRALHAQVVKAIEARSAEQREEKAALLAHHWEGAGDKLSAARNHKIAAEWMALTDLSSSAWHWRRVRNLLKDIESSEEAAALGVAACQHLLNLGWRFGVDAEEVAALETEGRAFARSVNDWTAELYVSIVCSRALASVGDVAGFVKLARQNYADAQKVDDTPLQVNASLYLVDALVWTAELPEALTIAEDALKRVSKEVPPSEWVMGFNPHTVLKFWRATCLVMMGRLDEGLEEYRQCLPLLEADGTPEGVAYLLSWSALAYLSAGDIKQVEACSDQVDDVCTKIGDPDTIVAHRLLCQTYVHLGNGRAAEAVPTAKAALEIHRHHEQQHAGMTATFVAEALMRSGNSSEAVDMANDAIEICRQSLRANLEAQAHCVLAASLLARDGPKGVKAAKQSASVASDLIESTGARTILPSLLEIRALIAATDGDQASQLEFMQQAASVYEEIGASPHAERIRSALQST